MRTHSFLKTAMQSFFLASFVFLVSCNNDDNEETTDEVQFISLPAEVIDTYNGNLVYTPSNGMGLITDTNGTATISGSAGNYTISFSSNVPALTDLKFIGKDGAYASVSEDGTTIGITIEDDELSVGATIQGNTWAFNGQK